MKEGEPEYNLNFLKLCLEMQIILLLFSCWLVFPCFKNMTTSKTTLLMNNHVMNIHKLYCILLWHLWSVHFKYSRTTNEIASWRNCEWLNVRLEKLCLFTSVSHTCLSLPQPLPHSACSFFLLFIPRSKENFN